MIKTSFEALTEEEKDHILKTLIVLVFNSQGDDFDLLKTYCKYGAEAFDSMVDVLETKDIWTFRKKVK